MRYIRREIQKDDFLADIELNSGGANIRSMPIENQYTVLAFLTNSGLFSKAPFKLTKSQLVIGLSILADCNIFFFQNLVLGLLLLLYLEDNLGLKNSPIYRDTLNKRYLFAVTVLSYSRVFLILRDYYPKFSNNPLYKALLIHIIDIFILDLVLSFNTLKELELSSKDLYVMPTAMLEGLALVKLSRYLLVSGELAWIRVDLAAVRSQALTGALAVRQRGSCYPQREA